MYQGDIARLINRKTGELGWYQKLRCEDGVFLVGLSPNIGRIELRYVDESGTGLEKDFEIDAVLSGEDIVKYSHFQINEDTVQRISAKKQTETLRKEIDNLKIEQNRNSYYLKQYEKYKNENESYETKINALENVISQIDKSGAIEFTYAYGKHTADTKAYCWTVPSWMEVKIGDTVLVNTSMGKSKAIITQIEKSYDRRNHKSIIKVL